ncbi:MAG: hypothetical protein Kapaf2KO_16680 [Candidatus Kapaibacteriales bacterium]
MSEKIAFGSKDGKHLIGAFGSIPYFKVYEIKDGQIISEELRELYKDEAGSPVKDINKMVEPGSTMQFSLNVFDPGKQKHMKMAKAISDCQTVVTRKMCANARDSILQFGMKPIETSVSKFDTAIQTYLQGELVDEKST